LHFRTRTLLTGAALTLLLVACAAALGASNASAASRHASAKIHKISACGTVVKSPGTYELTKSLTDVGTGYCITLEGNNITLYLDGHTITGTGGDTCVYITGLSNTETVNNTVVGGMMATKKRAKPMSATLKNCEYGLYSSFTSGAMVSNLNIVSPTGYGVYADYDGGMTLSHVNVALHGNKAYGMYFEYGSNNLITKSSVDNNSNDESFYAYEEVGDTFSLDTAKNGHSGNGATGFYDYECSRDTYTHDASKGNYYGFYLEGDGYGTVTATHNTASGPTTTGPIGFYVYEAYQEADTGSPFHTMLSHNKTTGFQYGFDDQSNDSYSQAETWIGNTADNYTEYGFYIDYTVNYTMVGNVADANTKTKKYDGSSTSYGFYLDDPYSYEPFRAFNNNQAYDNEYGFYSDEYMVGGTGNVAKRNKYAAYDVEITG